MSGFETRRRRHVRDALAMVPQLREALDWPAQRIAAEREARLRALVRDAAVRSPWHRDRLADVDIDAPGAELLAQLPVMTKADLMGEFDLLVIDRRLTLAGVEEHLAGLPDSGYLLDSYTAIASGGSCGRRACFVYDWHEWATLYVGLFRYQLAESAGRRGPVMANVAAAHPSHPTAAFNRTFSGPHLTMVKLPVTMPVPELVAGLNTCRPQLLVGYPSMLHLLTDEVAAGRLDIAPTGVITYAEPLLPEARAAMESTWGVRVGNLYGAAEGGGLGIPCPAGRTHLSEDLVIIEPVDAGGRPVGPGEISAKLYLTNLYNHTMPLIRYEVTDEVAILEEPCPCGSAHRCVADIQGRLDDIFDYAGTVVHPHVFRSGLGRHAQIVEYQVRQTARGAQIDVRCLRAVDSDALARGLEDGLRRTGLTAPQVSVRIVDAIERNSTGKLKRFVPLAPALVP